MSHSPITCIQISDFHLFDNPEKDLLGQNTRISFDAVIAHLLTLKEKPDFYLATGDLAHDQAEGSYHYMQSQLGKLGAPVYCLPGNHDHPESMKTSLLSPVVEMKKSFEIKGWQIVLLDSVIFNTNGGRLSSDELAFLNGCCQDKKDIPTLVCLHHHPFPSGSSWLDTMMIGNPGDFFSIIDKSPNVKGIVCGHIHQNFHAKRRGVNIWGAPSTCVQFKPNQARFSIDASFPGYRWLKLFPDGKIETDIFRLEGFQSSVNPNALGY